MQMAVSYRMRISMGDVKAAKVQGGMWESDRNIYGDVPPGVRELFGSTADDVIQLEGYVCGLLAAPEARFANEVAELKKL